MIGRDSSADLLWLSSQIIFCRYDLVDKCDFIALVKLLIIIISPDHTHEEVVSILLHGSSGTPEWSLLAFILPFCGLNPLGHNLADKCLTLYNQLTSYISFYHVIIHVNRDLPCPFGHLHGPSVCFRGRRKRSKSHSQPPRLTSIEDFFGSTSIEDCC